MTRIRSAAIAVSISLLALAAPLAYAQQPASEFPDQTPPAPAPPIPPGPTPPAPNPGPGQTRPGRPVGAPPAPMAAAPNGPAKPKPYAEVITAAKTEKGLITTHRIDDRVYFEIPKEVLGKPILWVSTFSRIQTGYLPFGLEVQDRVVMWERRDDKILLRSVDYQMRSKVDDGTRQALDLLNLPAVLMVFPVAANGPDGSAVIDATSILMSDSTEFSAKRLLGASRLDPNRTFVDKVRSFPTNVELNVLATYVANPGGPGGGRDQDGPARDGGSDAISVVLHHTLVALPETPMKPRIADSRVGFFTTGYYEFGSPENRVKEVDYCNRWRLEKKDPNAAVSDPIKPITYYIAPEVPKKWHPFIKAGVEAWNAAFEKAGFSNAVVCREAPSADEDPEFDVDDARYNVVRWLPTTIENAYGPSIVDPRSGEILNASPKFFQNVLKLASDWYFTQASPNDKSAQKLPLPDSLTGQLLQYVVCHEIGHTLGFPHNKKASSSVSVKLLRDPVWTKQWGTEASIMDYGRFNYVAQPGDGASLIPKVGPYDLFAVEWGYTPIAGDDPEAEKPTLDKIAMRQVTDPMLRFGHGEESPESRDDPGQRSEDLGSDPLEATPLGLKNIDRVLSYIVPATEKQGEDYTDLSEMFDTVIGQRQRELSNVAVLVGGFTQTDYHYQEGGTEIYTPIPAAQQKAAVQFLITNAFATPKDILRPDILSRLESSGATDRVLRSQVSLLATLLADTRAKRMTDQEALYKGKIPIYTLPQMMEDVRKGIWSELYAPTAVVIDPFRRNLQRQYVLGLAARVNGTLSELRPLSRLALIDTQAGIKAALPKTTDRATKAHLLDIQELIQETLYPTAR